MKKMSLTDIQKISLDILKDVHCFCENNNINYSLAYGTLIGAVRHKGFIPWDDDIDIIMPRPDFERFCKSYHSSKYKKSNPDKGYTMFARVYDDTLTYVEQKELPWAPFDTGVWIDVFPIDSVADNKKEFIKTGEKILKLWKLEFIKRNTFVPLQKKNLQKKIKSIIKTIFFPIPISSILKKHRKLMSKYKYGTTNHCSQLCCADNIFKEYVPIELFKEYTTILFEGESFKVIKEYDKYLKICYGNYMQLPPEEERIPKQNETMLFYWK